MKKLISPQEMSMRETEIQRYSEDIAENFSNLLESEKKGEMRYDLSIKEYKSSPPYMVLRRIESLFNDIGWKDSKCEYSYAYEELRLTLHK